MASSSNVVGVIAWITGIIVSLAVGFALVWGTLAVPYLGVVNSIAGYVVIIGAILSIIMAIFNK